MSIEHFDSFLVFFQVKREIVLKNDRILGRKYKFGSHSGPKIKEKVA